MNGPETLGFIGLGVMGEPICTNLAARSGRRVLGFDVDPAPLARLAGVGVEARDSVAAVAAESDVLFLSLPGGPEVASVVAGPGGILSAPRSGRLVVDTSTSPVGLTRDLAARIEAAGGAYADAPVARTRDAARAGTLSVMVGASPEVFARLRPLLACAASEITHCGPVGSGQVVKILNNMVLFETVVALAEALATGRRAGVDGRVLLETLAKGSADSFALRNHGMKSLLPGEFPRQAFSTRYAAKDLSYALEIAAAHGVDARGAALAAEVLAESERSGYADEYFPALLKVIDRD